MVRNKATEKDKATYVECPWHLVPSIVIKTIERVTGQVWGEDVGVLGNLGVTGSRGACGKVKET